MAVLLVAATLTATATPTSAESVSTGYKADGIVDLIWATEHFGYSGPGEMQKAGVSAIRFFLGVAGKTDNECDLGLADSLDPLGPYVYESDWSDEEAEALEWVADHYCITKAQAQLYGGTLFTFFAGLDAAENDTATVRRDPPPLTTTTTTTVPPTTTTAPTTTAEPTTTIPLTPALALCVSESPIETIQCMEEIATAAFVEARQRFATSPEVVLNFDFRISPNSTSTSVTRVSNALQPGVSFWNSEVSSDSSTIAFVVSGNDLDWFDNEKIPLGYEDTEFFTPEDRTDLQNGTLGTAFAITRPTNDGRKVIVFVNISNFFSSSRSALGMDPAIAVAAHEWTHTVQGVLSDNYFSFPCWWTEGSASYFSEVISVLDNVNSFVDFLPIRSRYVRLRVEAEANSRTAPAWSDWLEIEGCTDDSYGAGYLATEYLVGQYGISKIIEMMNNFDPEVPWQSVMEQTFGILLPDLYSEIAAHLHTVFGSTTYIAN